MPGNIRFNPLWIAFLVACSDLPTTTISNDDVRADHLPLEGARCRISGRALLPSGDSTGGVAEGSDVAAASHWTLWPAASDPVDLDPEFILCRVDGAFIADFGGSTTWAGRPATFRVTVHDEGPELRPLTATRYYTPTSWQDDRILPVTSYTIPPLLPVVIGNAGNQHATLTFEPLGELIACKYRGGASNAFPTEPAEIALGLRYEFRRCERFDAATAQWIVDRALVPGVVLRAHAAALHVQNGSPFFPTAESAQTTVSAGVTDVDFLRVVVWDLETGEPVFFAEGFVRSGDFTVKQLF